ncbi:MAG: AMP-binding protein [Acidimicrobiia bacterium]
MTSRSPIDRARRMTVGEQVSRAARKHGGRVAYRFEERQRTWTEVEDRANRLAVALAARGVARGDRVAVLSKNRVELPEIFFGIMKLGAIASPVNFRFVADELAYVLADSGASVILVEDALAGLLDATGAAIDRIVIGGDYDGVLAREDLRDVGAEIDVDEDDPALLLYTSGTTGRPKGALLSHTNLMWNTLHTSMSRGMSQPNEVWMAGVPLFHIAGLTGILPYVMLGASVYILGSEAFDPARVLEILERERITGCMFVPSQWQQICAVPGAKDRSYNLRRIVWGASVAPPSVLQAMADTFPGVPLFCSFGQTEMTSVTCILHSDDAFRKFGSVGVPAPNVEVRLVDEDMNDVGVGEVGEIVYRGPTTFLGYWNNPVATEEAFAGGWFHSGDLCRMDDEGYLYVVDRKKDMIISGGENIYCAEVEAVIDVHPEVAEVAVIGVPHERWVETPVAVIVPRDRVAPPTLADITEHCRDRLASFKKPTAVVIVDQLPRNASGKVLKTVLRDLYGRPS